MQYWRNFFQYYFIFSILSSSFSAESFLESNFPDIFALCNNNLKDSIDYRDFFVRRYLTLIRADSVTKMNGLVVYVENSEDYLLFFQYKFTQCKTRKKTKKRKAYDEYV